jgi:protein TonB
MAYADQQMSGNKVTALIIVALIHIAVGYALVTGLAYSAAKQIIKKVTTVDIKEPEKPKEPPPPPPKQEAAPPPPVAPPVKIDVAVAPPAIQTVQVAPPPAPVVPVIAPPAPVIAPPAPRIPPKAAQPRGRPGDWVTTNDYPSRALREEREGTTGFSLSIDASGRVSNCTITSSSGSPDLDQATCDNLRRRARFTPATDGEGQPTEGSYSSRTRWVIPKD